MATSERYARLEELPAIGAAGIAALRSARVAVLGVGNIGGQLAQHLVLLGLSVRLVDRDVVAAANLGTQGFTEEQIGRPKSEARAEWLGPLNPACRIEPIHADIRQLGLGALRDTSLLVCCLDNRPGRVVLNDISMRLGIPWVDGALDGSGRSLFGRVACYDPRRAGSACYLCPHDGASLRAMSVEAGIMDGCSVRWHRADSSSPPTLAVSALGGAVASMQAICCLKLLLGEVSEVADTEIYFDLGRHRLAAHRLRRNPRCLLDHRAWQLTTFEGVSTSMTVAQTFAHAETVLGDGVALQVLRRPIAAYLRCPHCGAEKRPYRVVDAIDDGEALCACGAGMQVVSAEVLDRFGRLQAAPFLDRTWQEIGLPHDDVVVASRGAEDLHLLLTHSNGRHDG